MHTPFNLRYLRNLVTFSVFASELQNTMVNTSLFILVAITGTFGSEEERALQLFLRVHGQDDLHSIEVPAGATVQDVVEAEALPDLSRLAVAGKELQRDQALSDVGVCSECIIEVTTTPDIELLFQLFDEPADTHRIFGFKTYADFEDAVPDKGRQKRYMRSRAQTIRARIIFYSEGQIDSVERIQIKNIVARSLNWNTLQHFKKLKVFMCACAGVGGPLFFHKLPRELLFLYLSGNQLSGTLDFAASPPGLKGIYLWGNRMTGHVDFTSVPAEVSKLDLRSNGLSIDVGDIKHLDHVPGRSVIELLVKGNRLSGVMKYSEKPSKLGQHDLTLGS